MIQRLSTQSSHKHFSKAAIFVLLACHLSSNLSRCLSTYLVPQTICSEYDIFVLLRQRMNLNIRLSWDVGTSVLRDWAPVPEFCFEVVKIELSKLKPKVSQTASRHQSTLYIARFRIISLANKSIFFSTKLFLQTFLFVLLVRIECFTNFYSLKSLCSIFWQTLSQQHSFTITATSCIEFVVDYNSDQSTTAYVSCFSKPIVKTQSCNFQPFFLNLSKRFLDCIFYLLFGLRSFQKLIKV